MDHGMPALNEGSSPPTPIRPVASPADGPPPGALGRLLSCETPRIRPTAARLLRALSAS